MKYSNEIRKKELEKLRESIFFEEESLEEIRKDLDILKDSEIIENKQIIKVNTESIIETIPLSIIFS